MQNYTKLGAPSAWSTFARHPATHAVLALGITQIIAWGTTLYALGVLGKPIAADTGWSQSLVFGGLTVGLLVSSVVSAYVGRLIDRRGGRAVMSTGSILAAIGLVALSQVSDPYAYLAVWAFLGLAMRMTLYDAAFAALVQVTPSRGRRAISYLTLFGGLASTVFWPIGHELNAAYGWRTTLLLFAAINLLVCLPLHWLGLARRETEEHAAQVSATAGPSAPPDAPLEGAARSIAMVLFGLIVSASALVIGALAVHLVPILEAAGLVGGVAVTIASLKGVAQVAGRIWDLTLVRSWHPIDVGRISIVLMPLSFAAADAGRLELRLRARLHAAVRDLERARHHRARGRPAGAVRTQGLRRGARASWRRPTCCWRPWRRRPSPSWSNATAMPQARPCCSARACFPSSAWR